MLYIFRPLEHLIHCISLRTLLLSVHPCEAFYDLDLSNGIRRTRGIAPSIDRQGRRGQCCTDQNKRPRCPWRSTRSTACTDAGLETDGVQRTPRSGTGSTRRLCTRCAPLIRIPDSRLPAPRSTQFLSTKDDLGSQFVVQWVAQMGSLSVKKSARP